MIGTIIVVGVFLILAILIVLYRIHILVEVAKGNYKKRVTGSNRVNAVLFLLFMIRPTNDSLRFGKTTNDHITIPTQWIA